MSSLSILNQNNSKTPQREKLLPLLEILQNHYEKEVTKGLFFNLRNANTPLDIMGVLDVLKYKIQKWKNTSIYFYNGVLFDYQPILVIGSDTFDEAAKIIILVYISRIFEDKTDVSSSMLKDALIEFSNLKNTLEQHVKKNLHEGYPENPEIEEILVNHLKELISSS